MNQEKFRIIYQDQWLIAVFKPVGMFVHRSRLNPYSEVLLQQVRDTIGQRVYPVHRLDRATDGIVLFALSSTVSAKLNMSFRKGDLEKKYLAIVRGWTKESERIEYRVKMTDGPDKMGVTSYRRLGVVAFNTPLGRYNTARYSVVEVIPETGRWHQIRKHFHHISHPIIGDTSYGDSVHNRFFRDHLKVSRLLLSAVALSLNHPETGEKVALSTRPGPGFISACKQCGWSNFTTP